MMDKDIFKELYILKQNAVEHIKNQQYQSASVYLQDTLVKFQMILGQQIQINQVQLEKIIKQIKFSSHKNLSLCYLKMNKNKLCVSQCKKVLEFEPKNIKIIYRIGKAYLELQRFAQAQEYFKKGFHLDPHQKEIMKQLQKLQNRKTSSKEKDLNKQKSFLDKIKSLTVFMIMLIPCLIMWVAQKTVSLLGLQSYKNKKQ